MNVLLSVDAIRFPVTGIGRYTFELGRHLAAVNEIATLRFLAGHRIVDRLPAVGAARGGATAALRRALLKSRVAVSMGRAVSSWSRRRALRDEAHAVFHGPNFYLPPFPGASVVTIHDLSIWKWPDCHPPERVRFMRREVELSLHRAAMLVTDSAFTRDEVGSFFDWPRERIHVVPLAAGAEFAPRTPESIVTELAALGLKPGGYTLYSGTVEPRKNLTVLLDAYEALPLQLRQRWPLVICGYRGWRSEAVHARLAQAQQAGWLRYLGYLPGEQLPALFAGARLFAFPSLYEGFGLPVLEAMASSVPVICTDAASLPEVAGDAATYCGIADVAGWSEALRRGLEDEVWRTQAITRGRERASRFSWERCARETAGVYRCALAQGSR